MLATVEQMIEHPMLVKAPARAKLTARQVEVVTLIACGLSNKEISKRLNISVKTTEKHRSMIYETLEIHNVVSLTLYAIKEGFVKVF